MSSKSEREYRKYVLPFRNRQEKYWKKVTAESFVSDFTMINSLKERPYNVIRINESGDFWTQKCINKLEKIATLLTPFKIKVYCYTSRSDLNYKKCKNLIVSGSGFKKEGISNIFQIVKNIKDKPKGYSICKGNCKICNKCQIRGNKIIIKSH